MIKKLLISLGFLLITSSIYSQNLNIQTYRSNFKSPPDKYKPLSMWHWVNGEITKEGITKDLEGMKHAGIRGAIVFDLGGAIYDSGENTLFSQSWNEFFAHALRESERFGFELGVHNSPGWSGSGGPWVKIEDSMKKVASSEVEITGGKRIEIELATPPNFNGFYRDIALYALKEKNIQKFGEKEYSGSGRGSEWVKRSDAVSSELTAIKSENIINITSFLSGNKLIWNAPAGDWTILRLGYTSTGRQNRSARIPYGFGLEVDKYDSEAIEKAFYDGICGHAFELEKKNGVNALKTVMMDSWEVDYQNWSPTFPEEFLKRRGYSVAKFLPVLAGIVVDSPEASRRFLWDCRLTFGELISDVFAKTIKKNSNNHGKQFMIEPYRNGAFHSFDYGMQADIVTSEFWKGGHNLNRVKSVASIAHVRGTKEHRAEALTTTYYNGGWRDHPWQYKMMGDMAFCSGVNSYTFHSSALQPYPDNIVPGMSMERWGSMINRKQTWWPMASAYMTYLTRCQYLLRDGDFVGDVLFVTHEHLPNPDIAIYPELKKSGYDYDIISPSFFKNHAVVKNGKIHLPGGTSYEIVIFPNNKWITPGFLQSIESVVRQGVQAIGFDYQMSPSLENYPQNDLIVRNINNNLKNDVKSGKLNNYHFNISPLELLRKLNIKKDFEVAEMIPEDTQLDFIHHKIGNTDVYFVANSAPKRIRGKLKFRVKNGQPAIWNPVNGKIEDVYVLHQKDGITELQIEMEPWQSLFFVFDTSSTSNTNFTNLTSNLPVQENITPKLEIGKAVRGVIWNANPSQDTDITTQINSLVKNNKLILKDEPGKNDLMIIHYKINGEEMYHFGATNRGIELNAGGAPAAPLGASIRKMNDKLSLITKQPGSYYLSKKDGTLKTITVSTFQNELEFDKPWTLRFQKNRGADVESIKLKSLINLSTHSDFDIKHFSGEITYETEIKISENFLKNFHEIHLEIEKIANIASIVVNGTDFGILWAKPYSINIASALKKGINSIKIKVANSWSNRLIGDEYFPVEYMLNESGGINEPIPDWVREGKIENRPVKERKAFTVVKFYSKEDSLPPSGIFGKISLRKSISIPIED